MNKDIFVSYKNDGEGNNFAARLCADLEKLGYDVYYNPNEQHAGSFPDRLRNAVENCKDFLLILTQPCLDQLMRHDKIDWVREELLTAHENGKNIIPLLMPGVVMPKDKDEMPENLRFLPDADGIKIYDSDNYNTSSLDLLTKIWIRSKPEKKEKHKNTYQSNPTVNIEETFKQLETSAQSEDYNAMFELATFYMYQLGERDHRKAFYWYNRVLKTDDEELKAHALSRIAGMYFAGVVPGEEQSFERAFELREKAEKYDNDAAMQNAAMRKIGSGCIFDYQAISENFEKLSKKDVVSIKEQADFYLTYGEFGKAIELYKKIYAKESSCAYQLGLLYKLGVHTDPPVPDCFKAESYLRRAMRDEHAMAAYELGMLYYNPPLGEFTKDFEQAIKCFQFAADAGIAEAQYKLGWMYSHALGCDINIEQSIRYEEMAAKQGHIGGYGQLMYLYQKEGYINYEKAFKYAKLAADAGYAHGAYMCGNFLFWGRGCESNEKEALRYYKYAYQHGSYEAKLMIDKLELRNTNE